jgi:asparagine synthase (glutamine-hydrolysing)
LHTVALTTEACGKITVFFLECVPGIIDLITGHQPIANEDETFWIVCNGEIYNFAELRKVLEGRGHRFRTCSDTEVILHAFEEWGTDCLQHLRGMFAFAIYNKVREELFLARDPFGIKPLFYAELPQGFVFTSELRALLNLPYFHGNKLGSIPFVHQTELYSRTLDNLGSRKQA